jgi:predicted secreted protein
MLGGTALVGSGAEISMGGGVANVRPGADCTGLSEAIDICAGGAGGRYESELSGAGAAMALSGLSEAIDICAGGAGGRYESELSGAGAAMALSGFCIC